MPKTTNTQLICLHAHALGKLWDELLIGREVALSLFGGGASSPTRYGPPDNLLPQSTTFMRLIQPLNLPQLWRYAWGKFFGV